MQKLMPSLTRAVLLAALLAAPIGTRADIGADAGDTGAERREVYLKPDITVSSGTVRLGDLFEDAGAGAKVVVGQAPAPGRRSVFSGRRIAALARDHGLEWQPRGAEHSVKVTRDGSLVPRSLIVDALADSLREHGAGENLQLDITHRQLELYQDAGETTELWIEIVDFNPNSRRFQSRIRLAAMAEADAIAVGGRAYRIIEVPVLREPLARGRIIEAGDLEWRPIKLSRLRDNVAREAEDIIGKVAKRRLRAGAPLRSRDLGLPIVIAKGSIVTLALEAPGLMLSATGRALENGSDGALIRVMNVHSKRTVEAVVVGPDRVRVPYR